MFHRIISYASTPLLSTPCREVHQSLFHERIKSEIEAREESKRGEGLPNKDLYM